MIHVLLVSNTPRKKSLDTDIRNRSENEVLSRKGQIAQIAESFCGRCDAYEAVDAQHLIFSTINYATTAERFPKQM